MTTVLEMVTEAAHDAGVAATDVPLASEYFDIGLIRLNRMLAAWQNEAITIWQNTSGSIPITADTQSYAISERPLTLNVVNYKLNGLETPMLSLTRQEYLELPDKAATGRPSQYYYEREQTRGVLFVWTVPATATGTIEWYGRDRTTAATGPADTVDVPPEWEEAVHYGLAHRIASAFSRVERLGDLSQLAEISLRRAMGGDAEESVMIVSDCR